MPANLSGLSWLGYGGDAPTVSAARLDAGIETPITANLSGMDITLGESLVLGAHYVVRATLGCGVAGPVTIETDFTVGPAAALPTELGTLTPSEIGIGPVSAITYVGSCSLEVDADRTRVELNHAVDADPWRDAMAYETWVDGMRWRPSGSLGGIVGPASGSWIGRGVDVVYAVCFETDLVQSEGLPEGPHRVELRARVAGQSAVLSTPAVSVDLDCTGYAAPDGGGVGYARPDAGVSPDAGPVAEPTSGCAATRGGDRWVAARHFALLIALAVWARRRRRATGRQPSSH